MIEAMIMLGLYSICFDAGEGVGGGGTAVIPPVDVIIEEDEEENEPEGMTDEIKAYILKQTEKNKETPEQIAAKNEQLKKEAKAEFLKEQKAQERKQKLIDAKKEGNESEQLKLLQEERDAIAAERDELKGKVGKESEIAARLRIATKYKLTATNAHLRLLGTNEEEWEADAKELAKTQPITKPDLEGGSRGTGVKGDQKKSGHVMASKITAGF